MDALTPEVLGGIAVAIAALAGWAVLRLCGRGRATRHERAGVTIAPAEPPRGIRAALATTAKRFRERLESAGPGTDSVLEAVEEALLAADVGTKTTGRLVERVRAATMRGDGKAARVALGRELLAILEAPPAEPPAGSPWVILVTGVNGVGKTTTIAKLASAHRAAGRKALLVAADTFRAAAIDQLAVWAERCGADIVRHEPGADPSAVVFDGLRAARARKADVVLIDTAGRLHTRTPLMDELGKIRRTIDREVPGGPHEVLLVLDATTGQNALNQAKAFVDAAGVTGIAITKLDGTAKGGVVVAVWQELGVPVRYVGVGEQLGDLRPFDPREFVAGLLGGAE
jgi:fused signal recognition particle receptor